MSDAKHYTFRVQNFTPETMPFGRLVEYHAEIKKMLGVANNLHLTDVFDGSQGNRFRVDFNYQAALQNRIAELNAGTAPKNAAKAQDTLNAMLKMEFTSADFVDNLGQNVIALPGKGLDSPSSIRMRYAATFMGELYHIAGTKDDVKIRISTEVYGVVFCATTRDIDKGLCDFLFEDIKVSGRETWTRNELEKWNIDDFSITDFASVKRESLRRYIDEIRSIGINWPNNILKNLREIDEQNLIAG
jgi:hypothetical protein